MTGEVGRKLTLMWNSVSMKGVREKSITYNGEPVDVTSGEDEGWRTLAVDAGQNDVTVTVSGVVKDKALRSDWHNGTRTRTMVLTMPDGDTVSGQFFLANFKETGPYKDAHTFEATFQNSGELTYTPAS